MPRKIEAIRRAWGRLAESVCRLSPEYVAVLKMTVRDGGVLCRHCGCDIAEDEFGIVIFLATRKCPECQGPIELELASEGGLTPSSPEH